MELKNLKIAKNYLKNIYFEAECKILLIICSFSLGVILIYDAINPFQYLVISYKDFKTYVVVVIILDKPLLSLLKVF